MSAQRGRVSPSNLLGVFWGPSAVLWRSLVSMETLNEAAAVASGLFFLPLGPAAPSTCLRLLHLFGPSKRIVSGEM